jgi:hypothetical protein
VSDWLLYGIGPYTGFVEKMKKQSNKKVALIVKNPFKGIVIILEDSEFKLSLKAKAFKVIQTGNRNQSGYSVYLLPNKLEEETC